VRGLRILRGGMLTTVQDLGRWGHQGSGVPVAGPMDGYSHRVANRLVGNPEGAAALEVTLVGPECQAAGDLVCAVAGAEFELTAGTRTVSCGRAFELKSGWILRFGRRLAGARATLAVRGGVELPLMFGSRATSLISGIGPLGGRAVAPGDLLPIGYSPAERLPDSVRALPLPIGGARVRAIPGPQDAMFTAAAVERFFSSRFIVSSRSNRMGYRLEGPALAHRGGADILSEATPIGSVQVPGSGEAILLMADRQTTGGYPKIATVITADLPLAGQLAPGDWIRFARCTPAEAVDALQRQERRLAGHPS
jgi:antagonist of KipI